MSQHSSIVGGSTAHRVIACPGSVVANLTLPRSIAISSEYAEEGTFYHEVTATLLNARRGDPGLDVYAFSKQWLGRKFHDRNLTEHHLHEGVWPALDALAKLEHAWGGDFRIMAVEQRVQFPDLPGVFGTIDLILRNKRHVLHVDFKFGQGVPVAAKYDDGTLNAQLLFYTVAAQHSLGKLVYEPNDINIIAIIQPRAEYQLDDTIAEAHDLAAFKASLLEAIIKALMPDAPRAKGEHCRWAACKLTCPLWSGPLLDATAFKISAPATIPEDKYGEHLAKAKALVDAVSIFKTEVDNQLHTYLSNGGVVPGWRLKARNKMRQWIDERVVDKELRKLGFKPGEIWRKKLLTFEAADALAKRKRKKIPDHLRVAPPTNETTIASVDDPAPVVQPALALEQFRASFAALNPHLLPGAKRQ